MLEYAVIFWTGMPNITNESSKMEIYLMLLQHTVISMKPDNKAEMVVPTRFLIAKGTIPMTLRKQIIDEKVLCDMIPKSLNILLIRAQMCASCF